ncbi:hypothetical protein [Streptomyces sp. NPDC058644]|uniref:hypothetical protein n=1 Tax=unclassified Streptomyces TaxID=2593676 RepID=UPI003658F5B3
MAGDFLDSAEAAEVPLAVDMADVVVEEGFLIAPCNSEEFIRTGKLEAMVIGCTPVRVDLETGECRFLSLEELVELDL